MASVGAEYEDPAVAVLPGNLVDDVHRRPVLRIAPGPVAMDIRVVGGDALVGRQPGAKREIGLVTGR